MARAQLPTLEDQIAGLTPGDTLSVTVLCCKGCGGMFAASRNDTTVCSDRCRKRVARRKERDT